MSPSGIGGLMCLPTVERFCWCISLRLGSLFISIYSIIHGVYAGYNEDFIRRRELEINLNAAFCACLVIVSVMLLLGVLMEKQGVCLLWLWYNIIVFIPMLYMLAVVMKIHFEMEENDKAYRNITSLCLHFLMLYYILVVHSYRVEIEDLGLDPD